MASSSTHYQSNTCNHCTNSYQDPRILSCLHSYCLQCISKIHVQGTTSVTCPSCNHPTPLPDGGVASLPPNIQLQEEVQRDIFLQRILSSPPPICDSCGEDGSVSVAYCKECGDLLCQECWDMHQKMKMSRSHTTFVVKGLKEMSHSDLFKMLLSTSSSVDCPYHEVEFGYYCTKCAVLVHGEYGFEKHGGHSAAVLRVSEQVAQSKTEILQGIEGLPRKKKQLEQMRRSIKETRKKLGERKQKVDRAIQNAFAKLREVIGLREKSLLAEINRITMAQEAQLSMQLESLQHLVESMSQCHSLASIATRQYSDVQLLSISHTLKNRAVSLQQQFTDTSLDLCETADISVEINTDTLANVIKDFGVVADSPTICSCETTAVVPHGRVGVGAEMKVKVTARNSDGKELNKGGSVVRCTLASRGKRSICSLATDKGDGTYLVSVTPQQLGQHQLSITVHGQGIQGSPFTFSVVKRRDYTKLKRPAQVVTNVNSPSYIAFSDIGDMFVTSMIDHCIHVYDSRGRKKATIGSRGRGRCQFDRPFGIAISGEVVYVAEYKGDRIHKLTTGGEFLCTFGGYGSDVGQFNGPYDVKVSPDGKVYIADTENSRIQVFYPDWTISHVIDGRVSGDGSFSRPQGIAFDLSGDVHVTGHDSSSVTIFTSSGQFVRQYDKMHTHGPTGITIDPSGYSLVISCNDRKGSLSVFHPCSGRFMCSVGGFNWPYGVSVSPDGSVWVADTYNNRLLKY